MTAFLNELREMLIPNLSGKDGPFPPLLVTLTFVTGLVDAFSYLVLGHVFVANMTGNVVFLGFALAGASGFSFAASAVALASFWVGAVVGGRLAKRYGARRDHLLGVAASLQIVLIAVAVLLAALSATPLGAGYRYSLIVVLGASMGVQNAAARKIAIPDLTTTVLTMTLTGFGADTGVAGLSGAKPGRRLTSIMAMFLGALVGAACVLHVHIVLALVIALVLLIAIAACIGVLGRADPEWANA